MRGSHEIINHHIEKQHEQKPGDVISTFIPKDEMEARFAKFPPLPPKKASKFWTTAEQRSKGKTLKENWGKGA